MTTGHDPPVFASIVEGQGEEAALRNLLYHILVAQQSAIYPEVLRPWRISKETVDQPAFSNLINVPLARSRSPSFNRFCREVERLLSA